MPDLSKLPVPKYDPLHPYHWEYDNVPIEVLALRDQLINGELENYAKILRDAAGNQGTVDNRLNQSLKQDGSLKASAIDKAAHNIAEHSDGSKIVDVSELDYYNDTLNYPDVINPVPFVRMLEAERAKLALIASEATNITFEVETPSNTLVIEEGKIYLRASEGIQWDVTAPVPPSTSVTIKPVLTIPLEFAHRHYYDLKPITTDYLNYKVTSVNTPYIEHSLRVYINGVKLTTDADVYVPGNLMTEEWTLNSYTPDHTAGTFVLNTAITSDDIIRIDFDVALS
jgi:hypothetical protein